MYGPPGAGKTLVLFEMAREFVRIVDDPEKKVFICVFSLHKVLIQQLRRRVDEDPNLRDRVVVGDEREDSNWLSRDLLLFDETTGYQISDEIKKFAPSQSVVFFSSEVDVNENRVLELNSTLSHIFGFHQLSSSLRATRKLVEFVAGFFSLLYHPFQLPPTVGVTIEGSNPDVVEVKTPWDERQQFLVTTVEKLKCDYKLLFFYLGRKSTNHQHRRKET